MSVGRFEAPKPSNVPQGNVFEFRKGNSWEVAQAQDRRLLTTFHPDLQQFGEELRRGYMADQSWDLSTLVIHDSGNLAFVYTQQDASDLPQSRVPKFAQLLKKDVLEPTPKGKYPVKLREAVANQLLEGTNLYARRAHGEYNYVRVHIPVSFVNENYCQPGVVFLNLETVFIPNEIIYLDKLIKDILTGHRFIGLTADERSRNAEKLQNERNQLTARLVPHPRTLLHVKFIQPKN